MPKFENIFEQVVLLGLLPILGGSRNLKSAIVVTVVLVLISLISRLVSRMIRFEALGDANWVIYSAFGLSFSYIAYLLVAFLYPNVYQYTGLYILLIGVTPLTYYASKEGVSLAQFWKRANVFFITIFIVAFFRELIGFGSILGYELYEVGFAPLSSFGGSAGGFIILGSLWIVFRFLISLDKVDAELFALEGGDNNE
ncbi:MAG: Rnf-Nqr domain containing protein [Bacillota bacterium]